MIKHAVTCSCLLLALLLIGCGQQSADDEPLVVYSGRSQALVDELVQQFNEETGLTAEVRYGRDAQLLATIQEEGAQSPADVFWANTTGALGAAINADLLVQLPDSILDRPAAFVPSGGRWTPVTTRFRVLAYNSDAVDRDDLPKSVMDLPELEQHAGRIGWTPTYSSFQDFVTAMRIEHGREAARTWLEDMQALDPNAYTSNTPMIRALQAGEIDIALTNHYYVLRLKYGGPEGEYESHEHKPVEPAPDAPVEMYHFGSGDVGDLALVTGAGILSSSNQKDKAARFLQFLLSPTAQSFAAKSVHEYPVTRGVEMPPYMMPADSALSISPSIDFEQLRQFDETLALMREVGLL